MKEYTLPYGVDQRLHVIADEPQAGTVQEISVPQASLEPQEAVFAALANPMNFPALQDASIPGDRIVIAIHDGLPRTAELVAGIMQYVAKCQMSPSDLEFIFASDRDLEPFRAAVPGPLQAVANFRVHDPRDRDELAYLATTEAGQLIHINRRLVDADVLITAGMVIGGMPADSQTSVFPAFADESVLVDRAMKSGSNVRDHQTPRKRKGDQAEVAGRSVASEVAWLLGAQLALQVIPSGDDQWLHVLAGDSSHVARRAESLAKLAWEVQVEQPSDLVVAGLGGDQTQQTWAAFAAALRAASAVLHDDGAIVVCSQLDSMPPVRNASDAAERLDLRQELFRCPHSSEAEVHQLQDRLADARIYLVSNLPADFVEELGITPILEPNDVQRLFCRSRRATLLPFAQFVRPRLGREASECSG